MPGRWWCWDLGQLGLPGRWCTVARCSWQAAGRRAQQLRTGPASGQPTRRQLRLAVAGIWAVRRAVRQAVRHRSAAVGWQAQERA